MEPENILLKSRLKPGRMLLVDTIQKSVIQDVELKRKISLSRPHSQWLNEQVFLRFLALSNFALISKPVFHINSHDRHLHLTNISKKKINATKH